jgi:hypothetical protein
MLFYLVDRVVAWLERVTGLCLVSAVDVGAFDGLFLPADLDALGDDLLDPVWADFDRWLWRWGYDVEPDA